MHKATILSPHSRPDNLIIGVTRVPVPGARGQKYIFAPLPTKTAEFKVKNGHERAEKTKPKHLGCVTSVIFRNKVRSMLKTHSTKTTAVEESNNAGVRGSGGGALSRLRLTTVGRRDPRRCGDFPTFFCKKRNFRHI